MCLFGQGITVTIAGRQIDVSITTGAIGNDGTGAWIDGNTNIRATIGVPRQSDRDVRNARFPGIFDPVIVEVNIDKTR